MVQRMGERAVLVSAEDSGVVEWYPAAMVPAVIDRAGGAARKRFLEFFTATIRNENTRMAYARAVGAFFAWCQEYRLELIDIEPIHVAAYVERHPGSPPTVKQHLAAVRMLFDWLVIGQVLAFIRFHPGLDRAAGRERHRAHARQQQQTVSSSH